MSNPTTIIIGGLAGTGSTTVAKMVADELGFEHVYGGGIFRRLAKEAGQSLEQFMTELAGRPEQERAIDQQLLARAKTGSVVIESRVLAWLVGPQPPTHKVWLVCDLPERARRINQREATEDAIERIQYREAIDLQRYRQLYDLDLTDQSVFDLMIETTTIPAAAVAQEVLASFR